MGERRKGGGMEGCREGRKEGKKGWVRERE